MFAICIESSHIRGMGHLFRALNWVTFFEEKKLQYIVILNDDEKAKTLLETRRIQFEVVDLMKFSGEWEAEIIKKYNIHTWINDRLNTDIKHAQNVKSHNVRLITFDDRGTGAVLADANIAALVFKNRELLSGYKVYTGVEYLILNREIDRFKWIRKQPERIIVTLGGSDTYGVTIKIIEFLKRNNKSATVILGPSFAHYEELNRVVNKNILIKTNVPSLIEEFSYYDIAITGGGITPFEANASGLPCLIIASEEHEIEVGRYLDDIGSSIYMGYRETISESTFGGVEDIRRMSQLGLDLIKTKALTRIYEEILIHE